MSSFNITDTQTYLYCHVAIIIDIIDNLTDIIALSGWQYLMMPMSLLLMRRYIYIAVSVVSLTPVTISLTCRHMLTYIAASVVLLEIHHRRADIGPTYIVMSVILLILVTISVAILQYIYIAVSAVIINASDNVTETAIWSQLTLPCWYYLLTPVRTPTRQHANIAGSRHLWTMVLLIHFVDKERHLVYINKCHHNSTKYMPLNITSQSLICKYLLGCGTGILITV